MLSGTEIYINFQSISTEKAAFPIKNALVVYLAMAPLPTR
jgi:hypothetical protein